MAPSAIRLSVIICTRHRASDVARALHSLFTQDGIDDGVEIIVVENGPTDDTRQVVLDRSARGDPVRYVHEANLGLCHARNRGWREARAPIVAYLDDDAVVCPGWVQAIVRAFHEGGPTRGCVGGRVIPEWEVPPPRWLSHQVSLGLTIVDWSPGSHQITDVRLEWLVGANIAFRVRALQAAAGFHPGLDRVGTRLLSSGDVFMLKQVMRAGFTCWYEPAMAVRHRVAAARLTRNWFRRRYFWQGVSDAVMQLIDESPSSLQRIRDAAARTAQLLSEPRRLAALARITDDAARFEEQCWTWIAVGHVAGLLGAARR